MTPCHSKEPYRTGWESERLGCEKMAEILANDATINIGVLLGEPSRWLVDVDLDHPLAVEMADEYLPATESVFGRAGKLRSHRLYYVTAPVDTQQHRLPKAKSESGKGKMIVELRSTGAQTVFPPSIHDTGERIEWHTDGEPASIAPDVLSAAVARLKDAVRARLGVTTPPPRVNGLTPATDMFDRAKIIDRASKYIAKMPPAVSGENGHDTAFHTACELFRFGLTDDEARSVFDDFNARCLPPWNDKDIAHKLAAAREKVTAAGQFGSRLHAENNGRGTYQRGAPPVAKEGGQSLIIPVPNDADTWPDPPRETAFHGLAGDFVGTVEPHSEADPVALLISFLVAIGNVIGRTAHFQAESSQHFLNLFSTIVGQTSKGRKGSSLANVRRVVSDTDPAWSGSRILTGLSSGEGVIWAVRDPIEKQEPIREKKIITGYQTVIVDPGVEDKRLLVIEEEFANTLKVIGRDSNTLSPVLRQAWDTGCLRILTKNSPAKATGAHISIIGHITKDELRRDLAETEQTNGFGNRFLWVCAKRSKVLPRGGSLTDDELASVRYRLSEVVRFADTVGLMTRDQPAEELWDDIYRTLSADRPGLLGSMTARAEAQVMRLACLYAILDLTAVVRSEHLHAAAALWDYCDRSSAYIFGTALGDRLADDLLLGIRSRGSSGMTRTDMRDLFGRNKNEAEIARALGKLAKLNLIEQAPPKVGIVGRPPEIWRLV